MATYNVVSEQNSESARSGSFWLKARLDFQKHNAASGDIFRIMKLRQGWILRDSYFKVEKGGTSGTDWEIGYSGATTDITDISDPTSATEWAQGSEHPGAQTYPFTSDKYVEVVVADGPETSGVLLVMAQVVAGFDEAEPIIKY